MGLLPIGAVGALDAPSPDHLVVSEVVTGGASGSDELVELYNPTGASLPLEGLEVVYATASGSTVTRRAAWPAGAPSVPPGGHVLLANELGAYSGIADVVFAGGMAATGGSVALRIQGADTPVDAVGWGTAASTWMEGTPAIAPAPGASIERLPGGTWGSTRDTDDNSADFVERTLPDPQNAGSPPVPDPAATPTLSPQPSAPPTPAPTWTPEISPTGAPSSAPTSTPSSAPTATPIPSSSPSAVSVAAARVAADGSTVTVEGIALTASGFTDGGGYLADDSGGIAVLVADGGFEGGRLLRVTGTVDDRFSQRTIRASVGDIADLGEAADPDPLPSATAAVGEELEGRLVRIGGQILGSATTLSGGLAYDVDDGSGPVRVVVGTLTGIDTTGWSSGRIVDLVGVAGQRDSSGTGASGYRVLPRAPQDVLLLADASPSVAPSAPPSVTPSASPVATPTPDASADPAGVVSIADARAAEKNARVRVRGVVTLGSGVLEGSAVIQDASGAILLRLSDEAGTVERGELLDLSGARSTKGGMETIRVSAPPTRLGRAGEPEARALRTGEASESFEALLVVARGAVVATPRRAPSGTITFDADDGSGPLRVVIGGTLDADIEGLVAGAWIEVRGVLGQDTTGAQPLRGYRVWPREAADLRIIAPARDGETSAATGTALVRGTTSGGSGSGGADVALPGLDRAGGAVTIGATLVAGPWREVDLGGLLWDGSTLVALQPAAAALLPGSPDDVPRHLELRGLQATGTHPLLGIPIHAVEPGPGAVVPGAASPHAAATRIPGAGEGARWVSLVGRLESGDTGLRLVVGGRELPVEHLCRRQAAPADGTVGVLGVGLAAPNRLIVPCGGIRPASLLATVGGRPGARIALAGGRESAPLADEAATTDSDRSLAAALLVAASLGLLGAAALAHRLRDPERPGGADAADGTAAIGERDPVASVDGPHLSLVPLPPDRGSP